PDHASTTPVPTQTSDGPTSDARTPGHSPGSPPVPAGLDASSTLTGGGSAAPPASSGEAAAMSPAESSAPRPRPADGRASPAPESPRRARSASAPSALVRIESNNVSLCFEGPPPAGAAAPCAAGPPTAGIGPAYIKATSRVGTVGCAMIWTNIYCNSSSPCAENFRKSCRRRRPCVVPPRLALRAQQPRDRCGPVRRKRGQNSRRGARVHVHQNPGHFLVAQVGQNAGRLLGSHSFVHFPQPLQRLLLIL